MRLLGWKLKTKTAQQSKSRRRSRRTSSGSSISWSSTTTDQTIKNRKTINSYLRRMNKDNVVVRRSCKKDIVSLNEHGATYFYYERFVIALEVPDDYSNTLLLSTMVFQMDADTSRVDRDRVLRKSMELNYRQEETRGASLGLSKAGNRHDDADEIHLCFSCTMAGLSHERLVVHIQDFLLTATEVHKSLGVTRASHRHASTSIRRSRKASRGATEHSYK